MTKEQGTIVHSKSSGIFACSKVRIYSSQENSGKHSWQIHWTKGPKPTVGILSKEDVKLIASLKEMNIFGQWVRLAYYWDSNNNFYINENGKETVLRSGLEAVKCGDWFQVQLKGNIITVNKKGGTHFDFVVKENVYYVPFIYATGKDCLCVIKPLKARE
ncbi:hypothetical protein RFI_10332 [Reticulomyxa filosa]|uniref:Uncharacterized protein n=1 Tax=Reticulomyxa filosa TaxID=46433 RepID=X6NN30_RETFI|nr:hypothetical protein RFI_10332 [Reticulomyxa filosa]|eukprot:ETO26802.1 hypothetical protein RFI_10332 [Reticulomyxa filosa]